MDIKELLEKAFAVGHTIGYANTENHYNYEFERWWNDENTQEQVKNCSIRDVVAQSEQCRHDKEPITDKDGFEVCPNCEEWGENC